MNKFIIKFLIFMIVSYLLTMSLDYMVSKGQENIGGYPQQTWKEIRNGEYSSDLVILGTSRALEHYYPAIIDSITGLSSYNLGMGGYTINASLFKYNCYRANNPKPRYIVVDVDQLYLQICQVVQGHQAEQFFPLFYDKILRKELLHMGYSWIDAYIPMSRYWGYQKQIKRGGLVFLGLKHYEDYPSFRGYMPDADLWSLEKLQFKDSISCVMDPQAKSLFETFIKRCKEEEIQVILVISPAYYRYTEMMQGRQNMASYFDSVAGANGLFYFDYTKNYALCKDSTLFNAGVHLTPKGSRIFSEDFAKDINILIKQ